MNYRLKSSDAISLDSLLLNVIGYWSYFITISLQLFNKKVISDYMQVYKTKPILSMIDFFYASHCLICVLVTLCQVLYYRILKLKSYHDPSLLLLQHSGHRQSKLHITLPQDFKYVWQIVKRISSSTKYLIVLLTILLATSLYQAFVTETLSLLVLTKILTMVKLFINCIKYVPQLLLNYKKKSVKGYPFLSVYFDLAGGTASLCQICIDNYMILLQFKHDRPINKMGFEIDHRLNFSLVDFIKKNFAKCGLVIAGFFFDFCFLTQKRLYEKNDLNLGLQLAGESHILKDLAGEQQKEESETKNQLV